MPSQSGNMVASLNPYYENCERSIGQICAGIRIRRKSSIPFVSFVSSVIGTGWIENIPPCRVIRGTTRCGRKIARSGNLIGFKDLA